MATGLSYKKTEDFYATAPPTDDSMFGGFGYLSDIDINGSKAFLEKTFALKNPPGTELALDCGAGIGRVTQHLLMPLFDKVDLLEQEQKFLNAAKQAIGEGNSKLGTLYQNGLQKFKFEKQKKYDLIWLQWVLCYLNDFDFVVFLNKSRLSLKDNGVVVVKDNINNLNETLFRKKDYLRIRPLDHTIEMFKNAYFKVALTDVQKGFPKKLFPVHLFLLIPSSVEPIEQHNTGSIRRNIKFNSEISL